MNSCVLLHSSSSYDSYSIAVYNNRLGDKNWKAQGWSIDQASLHKYLKKVKHRWKMTYANKQGNTIGSLRFSTQLSSQPNSFLLLTYESLDVLTGHHVWTMWMTLVQIFEFALALYYTNLHNGSFLIVFRHDFCECSSWMSKSRLSGFITFVNHNIRA